MIASPRPLRPALLLVPALAALALGGCKMSVHGQDGDNESASISFGNTGDDANDADGNDQSVAINVPGFSAKVKVPDLDLGSDTKIDDMAMFPGTKITGMNIRGEDGGGSDAKGNVDMHFSAPATPAALADYYKAESAREGWTAATPVAGETFAATKPGDHGGTSRFAITASAEGSGSTGHMIVTGR